jgi:5-methylcytosine-specific restriction endonuclease McrA
MPDLPAVHRPPGHVAAVRQSVRQYDRSRAGEPHRHLLNTQRYRRFRLWLLAERPLCQDCGQAAANEVHHERGLAAHPEDLCDGEQCRALCSGCHGRRTARGE